MIGELKPYPEYRDGDGGWLGQIPSHWQVRRLKYVLREVDARSAYGQEQLLRVSQYTGVTKRLTVDSVEAPDTRADSLVGYKLVNRDDLVINIMLAWNGSMGVSPHIGITSPAYGVYRFMRKVCPWYFHELLRSPVYKARIKASSTGIVESRLRLYSDDLGRIEAIVPPIKEQEAIVRFLAWANGRLERAIRAKRKVIALLNEQKQAIIHHAVTRGLDPAVPLNGSQDFWFPQLPQGWRSVNLRRLISSAVDGPHFSPNYLDSGVPFLSARNVRADRWLLHNTKFISASDYHEFCKRVRPESGDVLYTKGGTTGVARVVDLEFPFQVWVHIAVLKLKRKLVNPSYLAYCLNSPRCYEQAQLFTRGATNQDLGLGRMKDIAIPVPESVDDQEVIVQALSSELQSFVAAASRLEREIKLLREYQTRLISDVVTGKLDVREAATRLPVEAEPEPVAADEGELDPEETEEEDSA